MEKARVVPVRELMADMRAHAAQPGHQDIIVLHFTSTRTRVAADDLLGTFNCSVSFRLEQLKGALH